MDEEKKAQNKEEDTIIERQDGYYTQQKQKSAKNKKTPAIQKTVSTSARIFLGNLSARLLTPIIFIYVR